MNHTRERESKHDNERILEDQADGCISQRVGYLDRGTGEHQSNQVFGTDGLCRTLQSGLETRNPVKIFEGGGSSKKEQVNTNPTKCGQTTETHERSMPTNTSTQCLSKMIRSGGRGSLDRHTWDLIEESLN